MTEPERPYDGFHPYVVLRTADGQGIGLAMPLPPPDQAKHYSLGEHRMVQVIYGADPDDDDPDMEHGPYWQCFDHGTACWATNAFREVEHQPLILKCQRCGKWLTHAERQDLIEIAEDPLFDGVVHGNDGHEILAVRIDGPEQSTDTA